MGWRIEGGPDEGFEEATTVGLVAHNQGASEAIRVRFESKLTATPTT